MHDNDEQVIEKLKEALSYLDENVEVKKPELIQLVKLVNEVEIKKESQSNRQFIAFILTAVVVTFIEIYSFSKSLTFFIVVQVIALLSTIPAVIFWRKKNDGQVNVK